MNTAPLHDDAHLRVLVVDDEPAIAVLVSRLLEHEGYMVTVARTGEEALERARVDQPDLVVLDLTLPRIDGLEVCRQLRTFSDAYVLMLTARTEEVDQLVGLAVGADDYLTKPFSPRVLAARVQALLRRPRGNGVTDEPDIRRFGALALDAEAREVRVDDVEIELTKIEFDLLEALTSRPRVTFTRAMLIERVWGDNWYGDDHLVDVHIANLRRKLGDDPRQPRWVRTIRGVGYRMQDTSATSPTALATAGAAPRTAGL